MVIYLASDHGGFELKEKLKSWLIERGTAGEDLGAYNLNPEDDYPDYIFPAAKKVVDNPGSLAIIIGRSGNGEVMVANKVFGIRAALCTSEAMAKKAREDNDANILSLGADFISFEEAKKIVTTFLETHFSKAERHLRRLQKIKTYEESCC